MQLHQKGQGLCSDTRVVYFVAKSLITEIVVVNQRRPPFCWLARCGSIDFSSFPMYDIPRSFHAFPVALTAFYSLLFVCAFSICGRIVVPHSSTYMRAWLTCAMVTWLWLLSYHNLNKFYSFFRPTGTCTSRVPSGGLRECWKALHAVMAARKQQHRRPAASIVDSLPVPALRQISPVFNTGHQAESSSRRGVQVSVGHTLTVYKMAKCFSR